MSHLHTRRQLWRTALTLAPLLMALSLPAGPARAQALPDLVERAKPAILLVGSYGELDSPRFGFRGTGFVVGDGRQALTAAHVLPPVQEDGRSLVVQVWQGEGRWSQRRAEVVDKDVAHDVALLRFEGPAAPTLPLAQGPALREGSDIALIGFPLAGQLGFSPVTHRGILAARTAISQPAASAQQLQARAVAQLRRGTFEVLQLDITAYPGNSGGPVFDLARGEVVGIMSMVLVKGTKEAALSAPSGISYAVPIEQGLALLRALKP